MENKENKAGYLFQIGFDLGQGKNLSVSGNFIQGATASQMREEMDKVFEAMDHQRLKRMELPTAEDALAQQKSRLDETRIGVKDLLAKSESRKLNGVESGHLNNYRTNLELLEHNVREGEKFVQELREKAK